jgi:transcription initiation factor TFIIIB Brf1 subunit/transcription initiation factor TFIIB
MSAARVVWVNQEVADDIASNALQILAKTARQNLRFFCGKPPKSILGGLFYILGFRFKAVKTQSEIACFLCTTEGSVRKSYKSWLSEFPEQFIDLDYQRLSDNSITLVVRKNMRLHAI